MPSQTAQRALAERLNGGPGPRALAALAETLNEARGGVGGGLAQTRALSSGSPYPVQALTINGARISPYGRNGAELWQLVKNAMYDNSLSPFGTKKVFLQTVRGPGDFANVQAFVDLFIQHARAESNRVEAVRARNRQKAWYEDKEDASGWTRPLTMGRPAWPKEYRAQSQKGFDIRHVIRNATMKTAIMSEYDFEVANFDQQTALDNMRLIATAMGIDASGATHAFEVAKEIYKTAYLNPGNLFPGPSGINRVIGLTADQITVIGDQLSSSTEPATATLISEVIGKVAGIVQKSGASLDEQAAKFDEDTASLFLGGLKDQLDTVEIYLNDLGAALIESLQPVFGMSPTAVSNNVLVTQRLGRELIDIGANFGFDIPDNALESGHMEALINTEIALAQYTPGDPALLGQILQQFINVKAILKI